MGKVARVLTAMVVAAGLSFPVIGHAWVGIPGRIVEIHIAPGDNYAVRVYLEGQSEMCPGGVNWAFINEADSNYKVFVSALLMAKASSSPVTIYAIPEDYPANPTGPKVCRIGYVEVK